LQEEDYTSKSFNIMRVNADGMLQYLIKHRKRVCDFYSRTLKECLLRGC